MRSKRESDLFMLMNMNQQISTMDQTLLIDTNDHNYSVMLPNMSHVRQLKSGGIGRAPLKIKDFLLDNGSPVNKDLHNISQQSSHQLTRKL